MKVKDMMTSDPACCTSDTALPEVARMMVDKDCGEIPVVDDRGACVGMLAVADVALHTGRNVAGHIVTQVSEPTSAASAVAG